MGPGSHDSSESWAETTRGAAPALFGRRRCGARRTTMHVQEVRRVRLRRPRWVAAAVALVVLGALGSFRGADALARNDSQRARQEFVTSSMGISSALRLAIVHDEDLAVSTGAYFVDNPTATAADFRQWANSVQAFTRYPELLTLSVLTVVQASQLPAFAAREEANPSAPLSTNDTFVVSPPGSRPFYCFAAVIDSRSAQWIRPAGTDYCDNPLDQSLLRSGDSGQIVYLPYGVGKVQAIAVGNAIYRGGVVPQTVQARRDELIGWAGAALVPNVILHTALEDRAGTAVAFRYDVGTTHVIFGARVAPAHFQSIAINLHNGWSVMIYGPALHNAVLANRDARALLLGGLLVSVLLAALIYVLGTGRSRALALVEERTNQLHHQAFNDSLTGLPSRALILDRVAQMFGGAGARANDGHRVVSRPRQLQGHQRHLGPRRRRPVAGRGRREAPHGGPSAGHRGAIRGRRIRHFVGGLTPAWRRPGNCGSGPRRVFGPVRDH